MKKCMGFLLAFLSVDLMGCFVWWMGVNQPQRPVSYRPSMQPAINSTISSNTVVLKSISKSFYGTGVPRKMVKLTPEEEKTVAHFKPGMSPKEKEAMMNLLITFTDAIRGKNLTYMMYGGTLLGAYRHHGLIPWDDDTDLLINNAERHKLKMALADLSPKYSLVISQKTRWKFFMNSSTMIRKQKWKWPFLDISFYKENENQIWDVDPGFKRLYTFQKKDIFPLKERPFENITLLSPKNIMKVLAKSYDLSVCSTNTYNHKSEHVTERKSQVKITCDKLYDRFPFVFREKLKSGMNETLILGNTLLKWYFDKE